MRAWRMCPRPNANGCVEGEINKLTVKHPHHMNVREAQVFRAPGLSPMLLLGGAVVLAATYLVSGRGDGAREFWLAYVHNYAFLLSLSLGALFFVLLQHVTRSGWSVIIRRPAEILGANLIVLALLFVPVAVNVAGGSGVLYPWAVPLETLRGTDADSAHHAAGTHDAVHAADAPADHASADAHEHQDHHADHARQLILEKRAYLNAPFFITRWLIYFGIWAALGLYLWRSSLWQEQSADVAPTLRAQTISAPALVIYALTVTAAAFDLLMSLDPVWYSTIFGVYYFAGAAVGFFALMILLLTGLQRRGYLHEVTSEHFHDLGKWLFGFVFFWGYIAFSQYMLIWYGNIPEETGWFLRRGCAQQDPNVWSYVIVLLLVGHFIVPFVVLLSRQVKRHKALLVCWAGWMLALQWIDVGWLVMPELTTDRLPLGVAEAGCLIGLSAIYLGGVAAFAHGRNLVPSGDPRLDESLAFENI